MCLAAEEKRLADEKLKQDKIAETKKVEDERKAKIEADKKGLLKKVIQN